MRPAWLSCVSVYLHGNRMHVYAPYHLGYTTAYLTCAGHPSAMPPQATSATSGAIAEARLLLVGVPASPASVLHSCGHCAHTRCCATCCVNARTKHFTDAGCLRHVSQHHCLECLHPAPERWHLEKHHKLRGSLLRQVSPLHALHLRNVL